MSPRKPSVLVRLVVVALVTALAGCGSEPEADSHPVRTAADFDKYPCGVFTELEISMAVAEPFNVLTGVGPVLFGRPKKDNANDGASCVYVFKPDGGKRGGAVETLTLSISRSKSGEQQLNSCLQGAAARAQGYQGQAVGDKACTTPSSDLWMKLGTEHYHIVTVAQPGWPDPAEAFQATRIVCVTVAKVAADRLPRS